MSVFRTNNITNRDGTAGPVISGITTVSSTGYMRLPVGPTEYRGGRGRGLFGGGQNPSNTNTIEYITISSTGNSKDFGDMTIARDKLGACSSATRGIFGGGEPTNNILDYVTIPSTGNAFDFGDLTQARRFITSCSNQTRGIFAGGYNPGFSPVTRVNTIDYITISTLNNAVDFGDLTQQTNEAAACASATRALIGGGAVPSTTNVINYITIASTGDALDFGDRTVSNARLSGCSSTTRGIFAGGTGESNVITPPSGALRFNSDSGKLEYYNGEVWWQIDNFSADNATGGTRGVFGGGCPGPGITNVIDYVTISSTGNAIDFGDLSARDSLDACSSTTRGVFGGGQTPTNVTTIDYVTISSTGNAVSFGNLTVARTTAGTSSSTRGIFAGGAGTNIIDYITIASTGNAIDFGDLTAVNGIPAGCSSSTRGLFGGGATPSSPLGINNIDFVTISSTGNASDFGDLTVPMSGPGSACSNSNRGVFGGGSIPTLTNVIGFVTIATLVPAPTVTVVSNK
jgi:hypothetical protein